MVPPICVLSPYSSYFLWGSSIYMPQIRLQTFISGGLEFYGQSSFFLWSVLQSTVVSDSMNYDRATCKLSMLSTHTAISFPSVCPTAPCFSLFFILAPSIPFFPIIIGYLLFSYFLFLYCGNNSPSVTHLPFLETILCKPKALPFISFLI